MADIINNKIEINEMTVRELEQQTADTVKFDDIDQAKNFIRQVWPQVEADKRISQQSPELYERLDRLYKINSIILIPALNQRQLLDILSNGINFYFQEMMENHDIWEKVKAYLVGIFQEDRDAAKEKIRKALLENKELITGKKIKRNNNDYSPSIKEWLIDYTSVVGTKKAGNLEMNQYFTSSKNFQALPTNDKNKVRALIVLYEKLKLSSMEPEGLEEKVSFSIDGRQMLFTEGRFEEIGQEEVESFIAETEEESAAAFKAVEPPVKQAQVEQEVLAAYQGDPKQNKLITKELEKLSKQFGGNNQALRDEFFKAVQKKNTNQTIAILRLLTQNQDLENFIKSDEKLNKFLAAIWEKRYGIDFIAEFNSDPTQLKFMRLFLRYVLEERLGLSLNDAARIGLQLGNIFVSLGKKGYNKMAYFDVKDKSFKWFE